MNAIKRQMGYESVAKTGTKYDLTENQQRNTYSTNSQNLDYKQNVQQTKEANNKITARNQILTTKGNNDLQFMIASSKSDDNYLTSEITKGNAAAEALNKIEADEAAAQARNNDSRYAGMKAA